MRGWIPIARREWGALSRSRLPDRARLVAALAAVAMGGVFLVPAIVLGHSAGLGAPLLRFLAGLSLLASLVSGVLLTADCLSRERRDGTLELLRVTGLTPAAIVAGKFIPLAALPLQCLLATVPVASLTLVLGGVTAATFWKVQLVLLNATLLSLATGMFVSSLCDDARKAAGVTLGVIAALTGLPMLLATVAPSLAATTWASALPAASPLGLLMAALTPTPSGARVALAYGMAGQHLATWCLMTGAIIATRAREGTAAIHRRAAPKPPPSHRTAPRRAHGLEGWHAIHRSWTRRAAWILAAVTLALAGIAFAALAGVPPRNRAGETAHWIVQLGFGALKLLLASYAIHFLQDACRTGMMELLLITPADNRALGSGHMAALRRLVAGPALALSAGITVTGIAGNFAIGGDWPSRTTQIVSGALPAAAGAAIHLLDLLAVACHASRWGLHYDRPAKALARTTLLVILLPSALGVLRIAVDMLVIAINRRRLEDFRELARRWYFPGFLGVGYGAPRIG